jgi:2OG-Fe(II) oxygenase superfamily
MLAPDFDQRLDTLAAAFQQREPFRHAVIESFFDAAAAQRLLAEFPAFERGNARDENGEIGNKSTVERIRELGPAYAALDDLVQSPAFLQRMSQLTGIPDLRYDPHYFGGGTHENRNSQDLDAHVDFNRHPLEPWHRRLNLIVYLNPQWQDSWGGSLELHTDPRAADDRVTRITPLFNRGVIFETTEWSWHGFSRIDVPPSHAGVTRRSIALYFYTTERPAEELAPTHSTIYVERPLPAHFHAGHTLSEDDMAQLRNLIERRDQHNQRLYRDISQLNTQLEESRRALESGVIGRLRYYARRLRTFLR